MNPLPKVIISACNYYKDHLETEKKRAEEKAEINVNTYIKLMNNQCDQDGVLPEERERRIESIKESWRLWLKNEVYSIDLDIERINDFLKMEPIERRFGL